MGHRQCLGLDRARGQVSTALRSLHRRQGAAPFIQPRLTPGGLTRPRAVTAAERRGLR